MAKTQQQEDSQSFRWTIVDLSGLFLWIVVIVISILIGGLGWIGIFPKRDTSSIYTPESVSQILFYLGCVGLITKGISMWIKRQTLILAEVIEYFYLGLICGICFLCSLILPIPSYYLAANVNKSLVTMAFGLAVVVVVFLGSMVIRKYKQIFETKSQLQLEQKFYFRQIFHIIFQYKWLFLAPIGLLILPFLLFLSDIRTGLLWGYYQEEWLILPIIVGTIVAGLGYGGKKIKSIKSGVKFRNIAYSISGNLLIFISIGVYIILMLASLVFSVISQ